MASQPRSKPANDIGVRMQSIGSSQHVLQAARANELFIAVVGPAGSGASAAATALKSFLEQESVGEDPFEVHVIKASGAIREWGSGRDLPLPAPGARKTLDGIRQMQDAGDEMRRVAGDNAAVARAVIKQISDLRARSSGLPAGHFDGRPRAYIIDSLRHPAEAHLLRRLYQDAFTLVGVVCDPAERARRLKLNLFEGLERGRPETAEAITAFIDRDADAPERHGQHVTDTFHEADFFVDNSKDASNDARNTAMNEPLGRLVNLLTSRRVERPSAAETAMHHAHSAKLRSACMSRQVGAALLDRRGNVVATGTNEVPRAGGGVYGDIFVADKANDHRCLFRETAFCSSNKEQNDIIGDLITTFPDLAKGRERVEVEAALRKTRIGGLIEFSRAVHAEMDAILSAARTGVSPRGCRLFVTTFPCHYCARHIVTSGVDEVQYIEPYPKSRALKLHCDSITTDSAGWIPPSEAAGRPEGRAGHEVPAGKVLFRPFVGVAPRLYARVFLKDRDYKDKVSGDYALGDPDWGGPSDVFKVRYADLELQLGTLPT